MGIASMFLAGVLILACIAALYMLAFGKKHESLENFMKHIAWIFCGLFCGVVWSGVIYTFIG